MASIPESNNREIAITGPISGNQLPTDQISKGLLLSLERGWYDAFDIRDFRLSPVKETGALRSESRFLQIFEVPSSPENTTSGLLSSGMQNVISSLRDGSHSFIYAISSLHGDVSLLTGVRHYEQDIQTKDYIEILYRSLRSNYPGIVFNRECNRETSAAPSLSVPFNDYSPKLLEPIRDWKYLSCITGIPSLRDTERYSFSQSIDRLVDALQGETYLLMVIAEPILDAQLSDTIAQLRFLGENVHKLVRQTISESHGEQRTTTDTRGETGSIGLMHFLTWAVNKSRSIASSESTNRQISAERIDKTAQFCEQLIDHYIQRFQLGRSLGFWNVGVYLASPDYSTAMRSQSMARSLYSGEKTHYEPIRVLELSHSDDVKNAIANLHVPVLDSLGQGTGDHPLGRLYQSLGTPLTTEELSILVSFPSREVPGLKIKPVVDFNLNPPPISGIRLGTLLYRGSSLGKEVAISPKSLTRHTFVTGLTGSGKTNSCLALLLDAYNNKGINFLVIDPVRIDYRLLMQDESSAGASLLGKELIVFTLGDENEAPFRLNPFEFEPGFPLLTHIDLLKSVFNAAFPMYASMPYLLEEAIFSIYTDKGWDIKSSTNRFLADLDLRSTDITPYLPRLRDLYNKIDEVIRSKGWDERLRHDLTAAMKTRIGSLLQGGKGTMLDCCKSIPMNILMNRPVVLELRRIGDNDEKAFIMALLLTRLYEANQNNPPDGKLRHVTLIEEAHRLLRNTPVIASAETANPRGKAIEMFTDMMAEMRANGEGFIIVDQMPGKLVPDIVKGSNLKIVHRLLAQDDRYSVGSAMGLNSAQIDFLPRLTIGQAVVHSEELESACLVKMDPVEDTLTGKGNSEDRFVSLGDLVQSRFNKFKLEKHHRNIYQQFPTCDKCVDPCNFHPENNRWESNHPVVLQGQYFISILTAGTRENAKQQLDNLRGLIEHDLQERYQYLNLPTPGKNELHCAYVNLSLQLIDWLLDMHPSASRVSLLKLEAMLITAFSEINNSDSHLSAIYKLLLAEILVDPKEKQNGCQSCRVPCRFGHIFQRIDHPAVQNLSLKIELQKKRGKKPTYHANEGLTRSICRYLGFDIRTQLMDDAAYCWLVNSTKDHKVYSCFWENQQDKK